MGEHNGDATVLYVTEEQVEFADAGANILTCKFGGKFVPTIVNGIKAYKSLKTGEIIYSKSFTATGTVLDNIAGTAENMLGTEIPATFQIKLGEGILYVNPTTGSNVLWTNANATEHMGEYVSRFGTESENIGIRSQEMLESYSASFNKAMEELATQQPGRYFEAYGNWELGINTETGVVYHAKMIY